MDMGRCANVSVGIAGWSYPDWEGAVYPPGTRDRLRFIAPYVDVIEINSTFYRPPDLRTCMSWASRAADCAPNVFFTAKLHQSVTHQGEISPEIATAFHCALKPLAAAGKLRHLLAQFRYDYNDSQRNRQHLKAVCETFGSIANVVFELRHLSWQYPCALDFLRSLSATVANLDYPLGRTSSNLHKCPVGEHAYSRLHGRNAAAWFSSSAGRDETYDYLYSNAELDEIAERIVELSRATKTLAVIANNHYRGKEVVNALQLKAKLTGRKVPVPDQLVSAYPQLEQIRANRPVIGQYGPLL